MIDESFALRLRRLQAEHDALVTRPNAVDESWTSGVFERYRYPALTAAHTPILWRYDLNPQTNPYLMERMGINGVFNPGAIEFNGRICLMCRVEGIDRKSFFAVAESPNGVDNFRFWDYPVTMPETDDPDTNVYDMRLVQHEDGWLYGLFCTERKDPIAPPGDTSSAVAQCGIARTRDMITGNDCPICAHARRSSATSSSTRSSSTGNTPSTPGRRMTSSRPGVAAASAGASLGA
jgi:4-O-beta-D-mannosyl-D-glucose phosphorylase